MGLSLTVTVFVPGASREQTISEGFPRSKYDRIPLITGMLVEKVAQEGWSELVSYHTARAICLIAGMAPQFSGIAPGHLNESFLIRATIA
jgi:hypothetical protein